MWSLKALYKWFASVALLATIVSFSGASGVSTNFQKTQTELIDNTSVCDATSDFFYYQSVNSSKNQTYNQYTVFNFKCFLIKHRFDFNITFKTIQERVLLFENYNAILEQNLIAQVHSNNSHDVL